jgi:hypothetical protein
MKKNPSFIMSDNFEQNPAPKKEISVTVVVISVVIANLIIASIIYLICIVF